MKKLLLIALIAFAGMAIGQSLMADKKSDCDACAGKCISTTAANVAKCNGDATCETKAFEEGGKCSRQCDKQYGFEKNPGCGTQMSQYQLSECVRTQSCA